MSRWRCKYDWKAIREFYEAGHDVTECRARFGFSNGAWHHAIDRGDIIARAEPGRPRRGVTRLKVQELAADGFIQAEIADIIGVSRPTVCFHMRRLGIRARPEFARRYDWDAIAAYYDAGNSFNACQRRFGFSRNAWADAVKRKAVIPRPRAEPIELILAGGRRRNRSHVKSRLRAAKLKASRCEACGLAEWRSKPLSLELHHINGDGYDNRLENLRLLCPNCHSQTETWGGRNKRRQVSAGLADGVG